MKQLKPETKEFLEWIWSNKCAKLRKAKLKKDANNKTNKDNFLFNAHNLQEEYAPLQNSKQNMGRK